MTQSTPNLSLTTYGTGSPDTDATFVSFRDALAGNSGSNMTKIDTAVGDLDTRIDSLESIPRVYAVNASVSSTNNWIATVTGMSSYLVDTIISVKAPATNTGAATLNINSIGQKVLTKTTAGGTASQNVVSGDLKINKEYLFRYDGTSWTLIGSTFADQVSIAGTVGNVAKISSSNTIEDGGTALSSISLNSYDANTNLIINGGFEYWQRGNDRPLNNAEYGPDRWYILYNGSGTGTLSSGYTTYMSCAVKPTDSEFDHYSKRVGTVQIIENDICKNFTSSPMTLQLRLSSNGTMSVNAALLEWNGTKNSVTHNLVNNWSSTNYSPGNFFITGLKVLSVSTYTATTTPQSISLSGTTSSSNVNNLMVFIWSNDLMDPTSYFVVDQVDLHVGNFTRTWRQRHAQTELALCQRYYETNAPFGTEPANGIKRNDLYLGTAYRTSTIKTVIPLKVDKFIAPTVTIYRTNDNGSSSNDGKACWFNASATWVPETTTGLGNSTCKTIDVNLTNASNPWTYGLSYLLSLCYTAESEL